MEWLHADHSWSEQTGQPPKAYKQEQGWNFIFLAGSWAQNLWVNGAQNSCQHATSETSQEFIFLGSGEYMQHTHVFFSYLNLMFSTVLLQFYILSKVHVFLRTLISFLSSTKCGVQNFLVDGWPANVSFSNPEQESNSSGQLSRLIFTPDITPSTAIKPQFH